MHSHNQTVLEEHLLVPQHFLALDDLTLLFIEDVDPTFFEAQSSAGVTSCFRREFWACNTKIEDAGLGVSLPGATPY